MTHHSDDPNPMNPIMNMISETGNDVLLTPTSGSSCRRSKAQEE